MELSGLLNLPFDCVAQILKYFSILERMNAGRVCKTWLSASRSNIANEYLFPEDFIGKSFLLAQKYAFENAKSVSYGGRDSIVRCNLPSVEHIEMPAWSYSGKFFAQLVTKVLNPSKIISFINMDIRNDPESAYPYLALLNNIQHLKIVSADPMFVLQALKQLRTLATVSVQCEINTSFLVDILTSQEPPVLWKDVNIGLKHSEESLIPLLASRMPHLERLQLRFLFMPFAVAVENFRFYHPTLKRFTFVCSSPQPKIDINLPSATHCYISSPYETELNFESPSKLERLEVRVELLRSISFSTISPPTCLKHVLFQNVGYHDPSSTIDVILSQCTALETLHIAAGKPLDSFSLHNIASRVLRELSIINCRFLRKISIANNESLKKLKILNFSGNQKLSEISFDPETLQLPYLESLDVSYCCLLDVNSLAAFCGQVRSLQKLIATDLPDVALQTALKRINGLDSLQIEGKLMADSLWKSRFSF
eukprot:TRINITY_DN15874_c0_g1_i2.p1 TRINITY_DN15874_c0_g1~~TRINITY_DN15874_c0_g1_i2.p1  ORF type:complete len:482 (-),score=46.27 TRINITY_DN15874_c0_g1_i2:38-1483(-)